MLHWLVYQQSNVRTVLIVEASLLLEARLRADINMPGLDQYYVEGHELEGALAQRIPEDAIGRMMTAPDATELIERLERGAPIPKRPRAPPARRTRLRRSRGSNR